MDVTFAWFVASGVGSPNITMAVSLLYFDWIDKIGALDNDFLEVGPLKL